MFETETAGGSAYAYELKEKGLLNEGAKSPKLETLYSYVRDFLDQDPKYKVVIFTTYVEMVDLIAERLSAYGPMKYTGKMNAKQKEASKVQFQTHRKNRILVSSDAGGYGVDLPQANMLINYD